MLSGFCTLVTTRRRKLSWGIERDNFNGIYTERVNPRVHLKFRISVTSEYHGLNCFFLFNLEGKMLYGNRFKDYELQL